MHFFCGFTHSRFIFCCVCRCRLPRTSILRSFILISLHHVCGHYAIVLPFGGCARVAFPFVTSFLTVYHVCLTRLRFAFRFLRLHPFAFSRLRVLAFVNAYFARRLHAFHFTRLLYVYTRVCDVSTAHLPTARVASSSFGYLGFGFVRTSPLVAATRRFTFVGCGYAVALRSVASLRVTPSFSQHSLPFPYGLHWDLHTTHTFTSVRCYARLHTWFRGLYHRLRFAVHAPP